MLSLAPIDFYEIEIENEHKVIQKHYDEGDECNNIVMFFIATVVLLILMDVIQNK